ncbi:unnamed protein product [Linum tenue]|uniref:Secreted protein n=1 Tax=Linum tenue TaxID=586396 RepID=A0AAV0PK55_9ROSI|nr:unnamed protein product [Linum tenue]
MRATLWEAPLAVLGTALNSNETETEDRSWKQSRSTGPPRESEEMPWRSWRITTSESPSMMTQGRDLETKREIASRATRSSAR